MEPGRRLRVLVVEDDADGAEVLADLVHSHGHDAAVASTGQAALDLDDSWGPDLVLLDVVLPDMTGHDVARALRARGRDGLRIVALSGHVRPEDLVRSTEAGCDEHLPKPAPIADLERLLRARA